MTGAISVRTMRLLTVVLVLIASVDAGLAQQPACRGEQKPMVVAELLFGRNIGSRLGVAEAQWAHFLATEITPRFPDGLTVFDARGQWRNPATSRIARERSKVVMIAMPPGADNDTRVQQVIAAYKTRFRQQSVGLIVRPACVSF